MVYGRFFYVIEITNLSHGAFDGTGIFERAGEDQAGSRCGRDFGTVLFLYGGMADSGTGRTDRNLADPLVLFSSVSLLCFFFLDPVSMSLADVVSAGVETDLQAFTGGGISWCFGGKVREWVPFTSFFRNF